MKPDIAAIRERADKATEGPWLVEKCYYEHPVYEEFVKHAAIVTKPDKDNCQYTITRNNWSNPSETDLDFIAHSRTDIPTLLDYIAELETERQWVAVSKRLPNEGQVVDVIYRYGSDDRQYRATGVVYDQFEQFGMYNNVTHWMPLPPLPEVKHGI